MERPWWRLVRGEARWPEWGLGAGEREQKGRWRRTTGRRRRECRRTDKKTNSIAAIGRERLYVQLSRTVLDSVNRSAYRRESSQNTGDRTEYRREGERVQEYKSTQRRLLPQRNPHALPPWPRYSIAPAVIVIIIQPCLPQSARTVGRAKVLDAVLVSWLPRPGDWERSNRWTFLLEYAEYAE